MASCDAALWSRRTITLEMGTLAAKTSPEAFPKYIRVAPGQGGQDQWRHSRGRIAIEVVLYTPMTNPSPLYAPKMVRITGNIAAQLSSARVRSFTRLDRHDCATAQK